MTCAQCGRKNFVVGVRDDRGVLTCNICLGAFFIIGETSPKGRRIKKKARK